MEKLRRHFGKHSWSRPLMSCVLCQHLEKPRTLMTTRSMDWNSLYAISMRKQVRELHATIWLNSVGRFIQRNGQREIIPLQLWLQYVQQFVGVTTNVWSGNEISSHIRDSLQQQSMDGRLKTENTNQLCVKYRVLRMKY